jgi:hypothetical protein
MLIQELQGLVQKVAELTRELVEARFQHSMLVTRCARLEQAAGIWGDKPARYDAILPSISLPAKDKRTVAWSDARRKKHALAIKRGQKRAMAEKKAAARKPAKRKTSKKKGAVKRVPGALSSVEKKAA